MAGSRAAFGIRLAGAYHSGGWNEDMVTEPKIIEQKVIAFRKIHADFKEIVQQDKCRFCTCFHGDVLDKVHDTLKRFNESQPEHSLPDIQADFENWTIEVDLLKSHG
jgi:hypothetical protein